LLRHAFFSVPTFDRPMARTISYRVSE
jgi:hypothetical protein